MSWKQHIILYFIHYSLEWGDNLDIKINNGWIQKAKRCIYTFEYVISLAAIIRSYVNNSSIWPFYCQMIYVTVHTVICWLWNKNIIDNHKRLSSEYSLRACDIWVHLAYISKHISLCTNVKYHTMLHHQKTNVAKRPLSLHANISLAHLFQLLHSFHNFTFLPSPPFTLKDMYFLQHKARHKTGGVAHRQRLVLNPKELHEAILMWTHHL